MEVGRRKGMVGIGEGEERAEQEEGGELIVSKHRRQICRY